VNTLFQDVRYALRMLRKNPAFSLIVIVTLALGIGANAAMFSLTDRVLLQRLPVSNPDQLLVFSTQAPFEKEPVSSFSYPMYRDLRDRNQVLSGMIARGGVSMNVSYGDQTERASGELVSGNYFEVLGVRPWAGRLLTQEDDRTPGAHPVAVISYGFWERRFGKDQSIIGKTILVNEHPLTLLGVTPPNFYGVYLSSAPDVWVPLMMTPVFNPLPPTRLSERTHQWLTVMGRRKDPVSEPQAMFVMVMKHGIVIVLCGAAVGTLISLALSRFMQGMLFGISPTNALTFAGAGMGLVLVALLGCYFPARRATRVNPLEALRYE